MCPYAFSSILIYLLPPRCVKKKIYKQKLKFRRKKKRFNITCLILYTHTVHLIFITSTYQYLQLLNVILPRKLVKSSKPNESAIHLAFVTLFNVNIVKNKEGEALCNQIGCFLWKS